MAWLSQVVLAFALFQRLLATQTETADCRGTLGACSGNYDFVYDCYEMALAKINCDFRQNESFGILWSVDGEFIRELGLTRNNVNFAVTKSADFNGWNLRIVGWCFSRIYTIVCTRNDTNESFATRVCTSYGSYDPSQFKRFRNSSTTLAPRHLISNHGDNASLVCEDTFLDSQWSYNYSVTWQYGRAGSWINAKILGYTASCQVYNETIVRSTLTVSNVTEDMQFACILSKSDDFNNDTEIIYFHVRVPKPLRLITEDQIAGISASAVVLLTIGTYMVWRFWIPLRSFVHHRCGRSFEQDDGALSYDAAVLFDENGTTAPDFVYNALRQKLEEKWQYRLCLPGRDFQIGNDIGTTVVDVIERSKKCVFVMDQSFFESRWCDAALQSSLREHEKVICLLLRADVERSNATEYEKQLGQLIKLGVVVSFCLQQPKSSRLRALFLPKYRWTRLKRRLPPNPALYCRSCLTFHQNSVANASVSLEVRPETNASSTTSIA